MYLQTVCAEISAAVGAF